MILSGAPLFLFLFQAIVATVRLFLFFFRSAPLLRFLII
jgi:hypothetical protein